MGLSGVHRTWIVNAPMQCHTDELRSYPGPAPLALEVVEEVLIVLRADLTEYY
jgi:hypothetical protein